MSLRITVVYSPSPRKVNEIELDMPENSSVKAALTLASHLEGFQAVESSKLQIGIWGRKVTESHLLRNLDRIEIYRELKVNPKVARRERFVKQGARKTGLFARRKG